MSISGFSVAELTSIARTRSSASTASSAGPWTCGNARRPKGFLQPAPGRRVAVAGEQAAQLGGRPHRPAVRAPGVDVLGERLRRAAERAVGQCDDGVARPQQHVEVLPDQDRLGEGHGVAGDERQRVTGADRHGIEGADGPRPDPGEGQRDLGQRGEVTGPDGAARVHQRQRADPQGRLQGGEHLRVDAAARGRELVEPDQHCGADDRVRQGVAGPAGVAAQQPQAVLVGRLRVDDGVPVGPDAGRAPVDGAGGPGPTANS